MAKSTKTKKTAKKPAAKKAAPKKVVKEKAPAPVVQEISFEAKQAQERSERRQKAVKTGIRRPL